MDALTVSGLCKSYEKFRLKDVSFTVAKGEIMGFIGRNGAGKTTTLKSLLNFVHPDSGEIKFFGEPLSRDERGVKNRVGFVSGGVDFYMHKRLRSITAATRPFYSNWDNAEYLRLTEIFALDESKTPSELSAGMRVKYNLALALAHRAELLILDEPTSGLDPVSRDELLDILLGLARGGTSVLFSTHITSDLDKCADRLTYIKNGEIIASEALDSFVGRYRAASVYCDPALPPPLPDCARELMIGMKPARRGYTALISDSGAEKLASADIQGVSFAPADLETIMIHMEHVGEEDMAL